MWEATQDDGHVFSFTQTRSRTRPVDAPLRYKVGSKTYFDPDAGKYEEIGIPELWTEQADDTPSAPPVQNIKTSQGWFPKNQETAFYMFWTVMGKVGWEYNELKKVFTEYWGVDYYLFNDLVKLTDGHVYRVIENGRKLWRYNGPRYD